MPTFFQRVKTALAVAGSRDWDTLVNRIQSLFPTSAPPKRGTKELLDLYRTSPWLRAVTSRISTSMASVPWKVYTVYDTREDAKQRRNSKRYRQLQATDPVARRKLLARYKAEGRLREWSTHPLLDMLAKANEVMTGRIAMQVTQTYMDLKGETFWLIERNGYGMPVAFWPLPPHWIIDTPTPDKPYFQVSFPTYNGPIPIADMLWFKDPDPVNPYGRGIGYAESLGDELETDEYASKHLKAWFYNRARPDLLISIEGVKKDELDRVDAEWNAKNKGVLKQFRAHFVNRPMQVTQLGQTFQDQQMVPLREFERNTQMQVFGVPPEILGVLDSSNRSTIDSADYLMSKFVLVPRLEFLRTELQEQLVPLFDERIILDYEDPTPGDKEFGLNVGKAQPWIYTLDEWRALAGKEPVECEHGDTRMRPVNMVPWELGEKVVDPNTSSTSDPDKDKPPDKKDMDPEAVVAVVKADHLFDAVGHSLPDVKRFNDETRYALRTSLNEGIRADESTPQLVKRVAAVFVEAKGRRAEMLARTETERNKGSLNDERRLQGALKRAVQKQEHEAIRALNALQEGD